MQIPIDPTSPRPAHEQISAHFAHLIRRGVLAPGTRLPATRQLANALGIARGTVSLAYDNLGRSGLVRTAVGAGTFVLETPASASDTPSPARPTATRFDWRGYVGDRIPPADDTVMAAVLEAVPPGIEPINLLRPIPDPSLVPLDDVRRAFRDVSRALRPDVLDYASAWGYAPLRERLAHDLATLGMDRADDRTLLVNGSQQGLDLVARALLRPGDVVVTERPAYRGALRVFQASGARVRALPMDAFGLDLDALERTLRAEPVRLIYATPAFHNPTGRSMDVDRLKRLLDIAGRAHVPIVEDGCFRELRYDGTPAPALKALDARGLVIHLGTFSKTLFPGLRVGWLAAPATLVDRLAHYRRDVDLGSVTLGQAVIHRLLEDGVLERHLDRIRETYRARRDALVTPLIGTGLEQRLDGAHLDPPSGGMSVWIDFDPPLSGFDVARRIATRGVLVSPGAFFDPGGADLPGIRLAFSTVDEAALARAADAVIDAVREARRTPERPAASAQPTTPVI